MAADLLHISVITQDITGLDAALVEMRGAEAPRGIVETIDSAAQRMYVSRWSRWTWLAVLFLAALLVRLSCYTGLIGSDDLWYVRYAEQIASGTLPQFPNQFAGRIGVTVPVAALYRLFDVNELTTILLPLLASSASVPLLMAIGARLYGPLAGSIAALLLCTSPMHVRFATILVPEPMMEFWILVAVWCYLEARRRDSLSVAALSGVAVGVAYLTKEPAAFVAPALAIGAWLAGRRSLAAAVVAGALVVAGAEAAFYAATLHDPLQRIHDARTGVPVVNAQHLPRGMTASSWLQRRLFVAYPRRMILPTVDFGLHYVAAMLMAGLGVLALRRERMLLLLWAILPWAFLNFGTASLTRYVPMWAASRYISLTLPPLFVLAGGLVGGAGLSLRDVRTRSAGFLLLVAVCLAGVGCGLMLRGTGFRTREMAVLQSIERSSSVRNAVTCHTPDDPMSSHISTYGGDRMDFWVAALHVFERPPVGSATSRERRYVRIERDPDLGLPRAESGTCDAAAVADPHALPTEQHTITDDDDNTP
jgi:4-amino-4-deoxy-L-arabinose transferase-like glycosyltransferase